MRIVHISTSTTGGAGIVASRVAAMQMKKGDEVHVLSVDNFKNERNQFFQKNSLKNRIPSKVNTITSLLTTKKKWTQITPISISAGILLEINQLKPDVVHIHNWFNLLSYSDIENINQKYPIIFHIHDARLMTGGCHFTLDCNLHSQGCLKCPATKVMRPIVKRSFIKSKKLFENSRPYALIFPSSWLERNYKTSPVYANAKIKIKSLAPINLDIIDLVKVEIKTGIVCVISNLSARVKGFNLFLQAIEILRSEGFVEPVKVVGGNADPSQIQKMRELEIDFLGPLPSTRTLEVIAKSELIVVPSYSENSPTVILEANLLKTNVLVTAIEGSLELVKESHTGYVCNLTPISMAQGIVRALSSSSNKKISDQAYDNTTRNLEGIYGIINETYKQIINHFNENR